MKVIWLGQAGLLFEICGLKIMIDPYLSNNVEEIEPENKRRIPVEQKFLDIVPDVIICTHNHLDHTDPETLKHYLENDKSIFVLAPEAAWGEVKKFKGKHNYIRFNRHTEVTIGDVCFKSVRAEHSDIHPIGVIIESEGKKYYITGDTLYNTDIFEDIPNDIDVIFLPVNGAGNNMNLIDAKRFCDKIRPKIAVPMHCGLFDDIDMNNFGYKNKVVPKIYEEIKINY